MTTPQQKITIYFRNAKKLKCNSKEEIDCLIMRPDTGDLFINDLKTESIKGGGSEIKWKLEHGSGISEITEIKEKDKKVPLFQYEPVAGEKGSMVTELVENYTGEEGPIIEGEYYIQYMLDDGKETIVEIDPFIRIPPTRKG